MDSSVDKDSFSIYKDRKLEHKWFVFKYKKCHFYIGWKWLVLLLFEVLFMMSVGIMLLMRTGHSDSQPKTTVQSMSWSVLIVLIDFNSIINSWASNINIFVNICTISRNNSSRWFRFSEQHVCTWGYMPSCLSLV